MHLQRAPIDVYVIIQRSCVTVIIDLEIRSPMLIAIIHARLLGEEERLSLGGHTALGKLLTNGE